MKTKRGSIKTRVRRCIVSMVALVMVVTMLPTFPVQAEKGAITYSYTGYDVKYSVINEWGNSQVVEVEVTNTGNESIFNWAVKYDAKGEISNLWDANIVDSQETLYVIKNDSWNYEIAPSQSIRFGYILTSDVMNTPDNFELCSQRTNIPSGYEMQMNVIDAWDTGVKGELVICNNTDIPIEAWTLSFDTNFTIDNLWDGRMFKVEDNRYTVSSEMWINNIPANSSVVIGFVGTKMSDVEAAINNFELTAVVIDCSFDTAVKSDIQLLVSQDEFSADSGSKIIYFYANTTADVSSISLIDTKTNQAVATLVDDGKYTISGDDMMGDGVYSARYILSTTVSEDTTYTYRAVATGTKDSNDVELSIIVPFTEQELEDMAYVDNVIKTVLTENATPSELNVVAPEFVQNGNETNTDFDFIALYEKRRSELQVALDALIDEGKVSEYYYDEVNQVLNCKYANGISFHIITADLLVSDANAEINTELMDLSEEYRGYNAVIINTFEDYDYRTSFYEKLVKRWQANGMDVKYIDNASVLDMRTIMRNKSIVALSGHGTVLSGNPVFCLYDDEVTQTKNALYAQDIKTNRIQISFFGNQRYVYSINADFVKHYYGGGKLNGSFVFSESCRFMGSGEYKGYKTMLADAFVDCEAEAVIGFYNSVMAYYARDFMVYYFQELLAGNTVSKAFENAKKVYGDDDSEYRSPSFMEYIKDRMIGDDPYVNIGTVATPFVTGNMDALLAKELENGTWEDSSIHSGTQPYGWEYTGDARVIGQLGEIKPTLFKMAFLSTGIGSKDSVSMSGTQGSTLYQTIRNTNKEILQFDYDFVSEEPMEFVDTPFDDKFEVQILDSQGKILYSRVLESVNSSTWYSVSGVDFDEGDKTVFHTTWKTESIDISSYQNQLITIKFLVYDVGDSAFDSAVVLDNILCK